MTADAVARTKNPKRGKLSIQPIGALNRKILRMSSTLDESEKMKILYVLIPLLAIGCTTQPSRVSSLSTPFVEIYHEDEFLGAISIKEEKRSELPYKRFVDAGNGDIMGLGIQIIAENFRISEGTAKGRLDVTKRWIDPDVQDRNSQFPIFSVQSSRSDFTLKADSAFHVFTDGDGGMTSGYDLDRTDGWRYILVMDASTQPGG